MIIIAIVIIRYLSRLLFFSIRDILISIQRMFITFSGSLRAKRLKMLLLHVNIDIRIVTLISIIIYIY